MTDATGVATFRKKSRNWRVMLGPFAALANSDT
jgi:hypothetical protein